MTYPTTASQFIASQTKLRDSSTTNDYCMLITLTAHNVTIYEVVHCEHLGHTFDRNTVGIYLSPDESQEVYDATCEKYYCDSSVQFV
jgi:hypothetical protein